MCIDPGSNGNGALIYLLDGRNGSRSLDDIWVYDLDKGRWKISSSSMKKEKNRLGERSCYKMVFDEKAGCIDLLGKVGDGKRCNRRNDGARDLAES